MVTQIRNAYQTRQLVQTELLDLEKQRSVLEDTTADQWVAAVTSKNSVDPAAAVTARDNWAKQNDLLTTEEKAIQDLLKLIEERIVEFKQNHRAEVVAVLRDQIAALSAQQQQQEKQEAATENQLKQLWNELYDVDPTARPEKSASQTGGGATKTAKG
jgi:hypothetical protein